MLRYHPKAEKPLECYSFNINMEGQQVFYNTHISYVDDDGVLWLGATTGYQKIDTRQLIAKTKKTDGVIQLVLGSVSINDIVLSPGQTFNGRVLLDKDIIFVRELNLRYNENNIVVECSQPCGDSYSTDTYFYQLRGFSDAWRPFEGHTIILSNLPPGDYELYTRTQSSEAFLLLTIHIARPVWLSWWAISLYVLLLAAIVYGVVRYFMGKRAYQKKLVDLQQEQEQQSKMNELKLHFFTNISHDLRTPLSLIIGPVEEMMKTDGNNKQLEMVHRNAQHLLSLVNQILDFRRLEFGKEKLLLSYGDIVSLLGDIYNSFRLKAEKEKIQFRFQPSVERVETMFDRDKTTKIMMNLLSNAFKFTGAGESITVTLNISDGQIFISVEDTGVGISDSDKAHIFDRFYQSDEHNRSSMGSGIGLHIVREYVRLQGGEITVTDNPKGQGSVFRFNLPLKKNDEQETNGTWTTQGAKPDEQGQQDDVQGDVQDNDVSDLPTLLLVDDHRDLLDYMSKSLSDSYQIQTANNGVEALRRLESSDVDLIVCDVMMPEMNSLELCQRVKADINTSHIPVVLLTAKAMTSDELKGLEAGADDYITKPFSMDILRQRIRNLMDRNRKQHERFAKEIDIKPSEITVTSLDEQFIANAISIVEAHIAEPDFSVEQLSDEIGVHRTQLYKKLLHLTGKTPLQFVRIIRLKRGKQLLKQSGMYVSEVAYQVGFNSPRVFSKYFKEEFGITPKEYQK